MSGEVSTTIATEGSLLLLSFLFGIALMLLYDMLRIFRHIIKHGTTLLAVEDGLYWFLCAIGIFAMLYRENGGLLRWFVLFGVALGMLLENSLISPWVVKILVRLIKAWLKILRKIFWILERPGRKVVAFEKKQLKKLRKAIKIGISKQ